MPYFLILLLLGACTPKAENTQNEVPIEILDNYYERPGNHEEPEELETVPVSEKEYNIYVTNINPHRAYFEKFFEEQLSIYGKDDNGNRLVNLDGIIQLYQETGVSFYRSDSQLYLKIVEYGKTNLHPLEDL